MKKTRDKGITLVALIITIVVLLILAVIAIGAVRENNVIGHIQNARNIDTIAKEKEQLGLAIDEWSLEKAIPGNNPVLKTIIQNELQGKIKEIIENENGLLEVTFNKTGNVYTIRKDGEILPISEEIKLSSTTLSMTPGETVQITATVIGNRENLTWISKNSNIVTVTVSEDTLTAILSIAEGVKIEETVEIEIEARTKNTTAICKVIVVPPAEPKMVELTVKATGHSDATVTIFDSSDSVVAQNVGEVSAIVMEGSTLWYTIEKKYYQKITSEQFNIDSNIEKEHSLTMNKIINTSARGPSNAVGDNSDIKNISYACSRPYADNNRANSGTATNRTVTYTFSGFNLPADALVQGIFFRSRHGTSSNVINTDMHFTLKISGSANYTIFDEENDTDSMGDDTGRWRYVTTARKCMARFYVWRK